MPSGKKSNVAIDAITFISAPTTVPTQLPTPDTQNPTAKPTTALPVPSPTSIPIPTPTNMPIPGPTPIPFPAPTAVPIPQPNPQPTFIPIPSPTSNPTPIPLPKPSSVPVSVPTTKNHPTPAPTIFEPSSVPVPQPTYVPIPQPTSNPTMNPTLLPIPQPTITPTFTATNIPNSVPSSAPTLRRILAVDVGFDLDATIEASNRASKMVKDILIEAIEDSPDIGDHPQVNNFNLVSTTTFTSRRSLMSRVSTRVPPTVAMEQHLRKLSVIWSVSCNVEIDYASSTANNVMEAESIVLIVLKSANFSTALAYNVSATIIDDTIVVTPVDPEPISTSSTSPVKDELVSAATATIVIIATLVILCTICAIYKVIIIHNPPTCLSMIILICFYLTLSLSWY